jgi:peptide/nickel transport system permease protein
VAERGTRSSFRDPVLRLGIALLAALALAALVGPWIYRVDPDAQPDAAVGLWQPPGSAFVAVHLRDGSWLLAERAERTPSGLRVFRLGGEQEITAETVTNLAAGGVHDRVRFPLGSDRLGRDVLARLLRGARVSLIVGLSALAIGLGLGIAVGGLAGGLGGAADAGLMRLVDALLCFPQLVLVLALAALLGPSLPLTVLVLGATCWMPIARLVRAEVAALQSQEFVLAARAVGEGRLRILARHLLPNAIGPALVAGALLVGDLILGESALSFLGLGVQPPTASWGAMIADARDALPLAWWGAVYPGAALVLTVIASNLVAEGLRDARDPRRATAAAEPATATTS